jgi:hypothetical protein
MSAWTMRLDHGGRLCRSKRGVKIHGQAADGLPLVLVGLVDGIIGDLQKLHRYVLEHSNSDMGNY